MEAMDFEKAIAAHADWKVKLRMAIQAKSALDVAEVSADNCCMLGKWLHGEARLKFAGKPEYSDCLAKHRTFHATAGVVARTINAGDYDAATAMLGPGAPYAAASSDVGTAINRLKRIVVPA